MPAFKLSDAVVPQTVTGQRDSMRAVIRSAVEWQDFWRIIRQPYVDVVPAPQVDFARDMLIVAALGERSGAQEIAIDSVALSSGRLLVYVQRLEAAEGCPVPLMVTAPLAIVRTLRRDEPPLFVEQVDRRDCRNS